jgi:hypothetical protein
MGALKGKRTDREKIKFRLSLHEKVRGKITF